MVQLIVALASREPLHNRKAVSDASQHNSYWNAPPQQAMRDKMPPIARGLTKPNAAKAGENDCSQNSAAHSV